MNLKGFLRLFAGVCIVMSTTGADGAERDLMSSTWEATDALGRQLPTFEEVGPSREDRFVGMFYFLWLGQHGQTGPHDVTKILAENPDAMGDADNPAWGPRQHFHHWGEPLFGYYTFEDEWIYRKHAQMLADADIDVIIFDVTNQHTYRSSYMILCKVFTEIRQEGGRTPQIAFLAPFWNPKKVVKELHEELYGPGLYEDLWFEWEGKPLIMADKEKVDPELRDFFTFRRPEPSYFLGPCMADQWGWLEVYPQHVFKNAAGEDEQMTVGVGQNAVGDRLASMSEKGAKGRSFAGGKMSEEPGAVNYGLNFAEQWERALEVDPKFVFITGWNEWIAMRLSEFGGVKEPVMFVDQFDQEHSRDIEPMKDGHGDNYYYQLVSYVRRYKGALPQQPGSAPRSILIDGSFDYWSEVGPEFRNHIGSAIDRDHSGWGEAGPYINSTGRNDLILHKVARDEENLYFYAKTREEITPYTDPNWMMLFINSDRNRETGWEGYNFVLNRLPATAESAQLEKSEKGWNWETVGEVRYKVEGNEMELAIPRAFLGFDPEQSIDIEFKWADNIQKEDDVMEFLIDGDAAPSGRFNYRYFQQ